MIISSTEDNKDKLVSVPDVNISQSGSDYVELQWEDSSLINSLDIVSPYHVIYIIEKSHPNLYNPSELTQSLIAWVGIVLVRSWMSLMSCLSVHMSVIIFKCWLRIWMRFFFKPQYCHSGFLETGGISGIPTL